MSDIDLLDVLRGVVPDPAVQDWFEEAKRIGREKLVILWLYHEMVYLRELEFQLHKDQVKKARKWRSAVLQWLLAEARWTAYQLHEGRSTDLPWVRNLPDYSKRGELREFF